MSNYCYGNKTWTEQFGYRTESEQHQAFFSLSDLWDPNWKERIIADQAKTKKEQENWKLLQSLKKKYNW